MTLSFTGRKRFRKYFGHMVEVAEMPNLIEVQKTSYDQFLQVEKPEGGRIDMGLEAVFKSVFPISDFSETSLLEYVDYHFEEPKYDVEECQQRSMTYAAPLKVTLRLIVFDVDQETGAKSVKHNKDGSWSTPLDAGWMRNAKSTSDWKNAKSGEVVLEAGSKITVRALRKL